MSIAKADVVVFCALFEEAKAVLKEFERRAGRRFTTEFSDRGREGKVIQITNVEGETLRVLISWAPEMGGTSTIEHLLPILMEYQPRFAAMTGICAGDRDRVALGDIIIATRAYEYDVGKIFRGEDGQPQFMHDVKTYSPNSTIVHYVQGFDEWLDDVAGQDRPPSKRQQRDWLLGRLHDRVSVAQLPRSELNLHAPDWERIVKEISAGPQAWLDSRGRLRNPQRLQEQTNFPFKDPLSPRYFPMVMGSGRAVRTDYPFPTLRLPERNLIALDMEGAMFYHAVNSIPEMGGRCLVVKGVSDYADSDKDESYRRYAATVSALYMYRFIAKYVTERLMPRLASSQRLPLSRRQLGPPPLTTVDEPEFLSFRPIQDND
jgi:nucleoside phosphorylase